MKFKTLKINNHRTSPVNNHKQLKQDDIYYTMRMRTINGTMSTITSAHKDNFV